VFWMTAAVPMVAGPNEASFVAGVLVMSSNSA
jgi:hypothetical protein